MVTDYENRMKHAKEHTVLPPKPNYKQIEKFVMYVNEEAIKNYWRIIYAVAWEFCW